MQDEIIGSLFLRFIAMQEHEHILFRKAVIADTELFTQVNRLLEISYCLFRTGHFDLITACHDAYIGVLVLEAKDILVIRAVKGRRIEGVVE